MLPGSGRFLHNEIADWLFFMTLGKSPTLKPFCSSILYDCNLPSTSLILGVRMGELSAAVLDDDDGGVGASKVCFNISGLALRGIDISLAAFAALAALQAALWLLQ